MVGGERRIGRGRAQKLGTDSGDVLVVFVWTLRHVKPTDIFGPWGREVPAP
ncbi:hypothetical protein GCM10022244_03080 [Streptomyces gulbargensis]|uniref:Transposase n=1 Tax=Streptomyces gulbargensis TaxID=364901 RepID=A0ABP7L979_9ACTN